MAEKLLARISWLFNPLRVEGYKRHNLILRRAVKQRDEKIDKMRTIISKLTDLVRENKK